MNVVGSFKWLATSSTVRVFSSIDCTDEPLPEWALLQAAVVAARKATRTMGLVERMPTTLAQSFGAARRRLRCGRGLGSGIPRPKTPGRWRADGDVACAVGALPGTR